MSADYGFDKEKHAQTNGDMDEGGTALNKSMTLRARSMVHKL